MKFYFIIPFVSSEKVLSLVSSREVNLYFMPHV